MKILYAFTNIWFIVGVFKADVALYWEEKLQKKGLKAYTIDVDLPETSLPAYLCLYE